MQRLEKLFTPIRIGSTEIRNRIAMAPMGTLWDESDGTVSRKIIDYHTARAAGGVGLIIYEATTIDRMNPYMPNGTGLWDDALIPSFRKLTDAVHAHGAKFMPQLIHPGPESLAFMFGNQPLGPSALMSHSTRQMCREITVEEIAVVVEQFGQAARRAREAGCDGVEFHAAHCYLLAGSFLSPLRNRRTDAYGGSLEARLRFPLEAIRRMKSCAGEDFPIVMRISGDEVMPGGRGIEETCAMVPALAEAGVDAFEISGGIMPTQSWRMIPPTGTPFAINRQQSAAVKQVVDVPVLVVGRIADPLVAENILRKGDADMVVLGRALLADPELPRKAQEGRFDDIAPCIGCSIGCFGRIIQLQPLTCTVNPTVGREREMALSPAAERKKVLVAGGGPGGMEAARVAALRGHEVTLYEKESSLGGQYTLAAIPPHKQELSRAIKYLATQVEKAGGTIVLKAEVTADLVERATPDVLIVATGATLGAPPIPGIAAPYVSSAHDVLAGKAPEPTGRIVVIGGGMVGLEAAEFLARSADNPYAQQPRVTVIEMRDTVGVGLSGEARVLLLRRLAEGGVQILTGIRATELSAAGLHVVPSAQAAGATDSGTGYKGDQATVIPVDAVVLATGARPVDALAREVAAKVAETYVIGDAKTPRLALEAIAEGAEVGRQI